MNFSSRYSDLIRRLWQSVLCSQVQHKLWIIWHVLLVIGIWSGDSFLELSLYFWCWGSQQLQLVSDCMELQDIQSVLIENWRTAQLGKPSTITMTRTLCWEFNFSHCLPMWKSVVSFCSGYMSFCKFCSLSIISF